MVPSHRGKLLVMLHHAHTLGSTVQLGHRRFRCHTGHGFTSQALLDELSESVEATLWQSVRSLEESSALLHEGAEKLLQHGDAETAAELQHKAAEVEKRLHVLRTIALDGGGLEGDPDGG